MVENITLTLNKGRPVFSSLPAGTEKEVLYVQSKMPVASNMVWSSINMGHSHIIAFRASNLG